MFFEIFKIHQNNFFIEYIFFYVNEFTLYKQQIQIPCLRLKKIPYEASLKLKLKITLWGETEFNEIVFTP